MQFTGFLPEDAPDPYRELRDRVRALSLPLWGFTPQPSLDGHVDLGLETASGTTGASSVAVTLSYPLWRNPADHSDPVNLAALDERTRARLDESPPWPRPDWLVTGVERMRYARLPEAVRTSWHREPNEHTTLPQALIRHARYVLVNHFREPLGIEPGPGAFDHPGIRIAPAAVDTSTSVLVDGVTTPAAQIDTDPFVFAIGFAASPDVVVTAVVPRDELAHVAIAFARWHPDDD